MDGVVVTEDRERERFELRVDGELAGSADYCRRGQLRAFTHTRIDDAFTGRGLAGELISAALDAAHSAGDQVLPFCEFVSHHIAKHPERLELVPAELRSQFDI